MKHWVLVASLLSTIASADLKKWNKRMQELSQVLSDLIPEIASQKTDAKRLQKGVDRLQTLVHGLKLQPGSESLLPPDADPSITMIADIFEREIQRAKSALKDGHAEYAKGILRNATTYCVACHSRSNAGPDFPGVSLAPKLERLSLLERAEVLAATRQFDGALDEFMNIISDGTSATRRQIEWRRAVHRALLLAVRVKQDPDRAAEIVRAVEKVPGPMFLKENIGKWKESIEKWRVEPSVPKNTEETIYQESQRLFQEGVKLQRFSLDHSGDIFFLRASAMAHDQLRVAPGGTKSSDAMLLIGQAYEVLNDPVLWPIHETYYLACIRNSPKTVVAARCYGRYEESVYFGYSGTGGFALPEEVSAELAEMKRLATGEATKPR